MPTIGGASPSSPSLYRQKRAASAAPKPLGNIEDKLYFSWKGKAPSRSLILVPGGRLELPRGRPRWILSPLRLPFRHPGKTLSILSTSYELVKDASPPRHRPSGYHGGHRKKTCLSRKAPKFAGKISNMWRNRGLRVFCRTWRVRVQGQLNPYHNVFNPR